MAGDADWGQVPATIEMLRDVAGRTLTIMGAIPDTSIPGTGAFIFKEPFGVNLSIAPWYEQLARWSLL